jgi:hypothetical protein
MAKVTVNQLLKAAEDWGYYTVRELPTSELSAYHERFTDFDQAKEFWQGLVDSGYEYASVERFTYATGNYELVLPEDPYLRGYIEGYEQAALGDVPKGVDKARKPKDDWELGVIDGVGDYTGEDN